MSEGFVTNEDSNQLNSNRSSKENKLVAKMFSQKSTINIEYQRDDDYASTVTLSDAFHKLGDNQWNPVTFPSP